MGAQAPSTHPQGWENGGIGVPKPGHKWVNRLRYSCVAHPHLSFRAVGIIGTCVRVLNVLKAPRPAGVDESVAWAASKLESGSRYADIIGGASRAQLEQLVSFGRSHRGEQRGGEQPGGAPL